MVTSSSQPREHDTADRADDPAYARGGFVRGLRRLLGHPVLLALAVVVAALAGLVSGYRISLSPASLEPRSTSYGFAAVELLVDSPRSTLSNSRTDLGPLGARAEVFASVLTSDPVRARIAKRLNVSGDDISLQVLQDGLSVGDNSDAQGQLDAVVRSSANYRLTFKAQRRGPQGAIALPLISVTGEAPTSVQATKLVDAASSAATGYLAERSRKRDVNQKTAAQVNPIGAARGTTVSTSTNKAMVILVGLIVFFVACASILFAESLVRDWGATRPAQKTTRRERRASRNAEPVHSDSSAT